MFCDNKEGRASQACERRGTQKPLGERRDGVTHDWHSGSKTWCQAEMTLQEITHKKNTCLNNEHSFYLLVNNLRRPRQGQMEFSRQLQSAGAA